MLRRLAPHRSGLLSVRARVEFVRPLATAPSGSDKDEKKPTRWEQLKSTVREHGMVFVGYYATTYAAGFGVCWSAITVGGLDGVALLQWLGVDNVFDTSMLSTRVVNALIALECNEMLDVVRLPFVLATTPALSRRLRGPPPTPGDDESKGATSTSTTTTTPAGRGSRKSKAKG